MLSHGIYSVILLIFSNVFMTFAWYGHLKMRQEFSWFAALPLIGVIAFSWAIAFFCILNYTYMKKEQSAKLLKEIEKFNFIKYNDLLTIQ